MLALFIQHNTLKIQSNCWEYQSFVPFYWWVNITLYGGTSVCLTIHPWKAIWVVFTMGLFTNKMLINIHVQVCMFNFLRNYQTDLQSGSTILHSQQQSMRETVSLHPHQHLVFSVCFTLVVVTGLWCYLIVLIIWISLMASSIKGKYKKLT